MTHPLHEIIGESINDEILPGCKVIKDPACGGRQHIPLFCSEKKSRETEYCNVDLLITKDNKIKVIIEIEEANIKPTQICGKFLTAALAPYFIHASEKNKRIGMADSVLFIQILDTSKLRIEKTSKTKQWERIEESLRNIAPMKGSKINSYKLFYGNKSNFNIKQMVDYIIKFINK